MVTTAPAQLFFFGHGRILSLPN
uniref:Uncharacterized protein n=1 Tax=Arundo donax TaxID=35708 RepID=A0A0A8XUV4_ARUDO